MKSELTENNINNFLDDSKFEDHQNSFTKALRDLKSYKNGISTAHITAIPKKNT